MPTQRMELEAQKGKRLTRAGTAALAAAWQDTVGTPLAYHHHLEFPRRERERPAGAQRPIVKREEGGQGAAELKRVEERRKRKRGMYRAGLKLDFLLYF